MLVRFNKVQKDLEVSDAAWFVSKFHKELEHQLDRLTYKTPSSREHEKHTSVTDVHASIRMDKQTLDVK